jgi:mono/diheme cytochrome c family protein
MARHFTRALRASLARRHWRAAWQVAALVGALPDALAGTPTYNGAIAGILDRHCVGCHRPEGMYGAAPLDSYAAIRPQLAAVRAAVAARTMPPWLADPDHSAKFRNDARLAPEELGALLSWIDGGAAEGPGVRPPLPSFTAGWQHPSGRPPDAIVTLPEFSLRADGEIPYVQLRAPAPVDGDRWITGLQVLPSNALVVHHMGIAEVRLAAAATDVDVAQVEELARRLGRPAGSFLRTVPAVVDPNDGDAYDMLDAYTPGAGYESWGPGTAKLLRGGRGLFLNFNIHYTTTGRPETDRSRLGLWFATDPPKHQLLRVPSPGKSVIANGEMLFPDDAGTRAEGTDVAIPPIPPFAADYELTGVVAYARPVTLFTFQPHAHLRARDFTYVVVRPDGSEETLLSVPRYDFHWQLSYQLATPLRLPAGSKLVVTAHYDNSERNEHLREAAANDPARNCGPEKQAYFRDQNQSWDEMFSPLVQYSVDRDPAPRKEPLPAALPTVATVGCLVPHGEAGWALEKATPAETGTPQSMRRTELAAARGRAPGDARYTLLGARFFRPEQQQGLRALVKGVLVHGPRGEGINVTALKATGVSCEEP